MIFLRCILILNLCVAFNTHVEGSVLSVGYLKLFNENKKDVDKQVVRPGDELTIEVKYTRQGFSKESIAKIKIEIFGVSGNIMLQDELTKEALEGTRFDRYNFTIPEKASGHFLVVLTITVFQGDEIYSEITKTVPFQVIG